MPVVTYVPAKKFAINRGYCKRFYVFYGGDNTTTSISISGNVVHMHYAVPGFFFDTYITLLPAFVPWSSNRYTLDFIVVSEYSLANGGGAPISSPYRLAAGWDLFASGLYTAIEYIGGANYFHIDIANSPDNYWMHLPP